MKLTANEIGILAQALGAAQIQGKDGIAVGNLLNKLTNEYTIEFAKEEAAKTTPVETQKSVKK